MKLSEYLKPALGVVFVAALAGGYYWFENRPHAEEKETPGLGDKIERDTSFSSQFTGSVPPLKGVKARSGSNLSEVQTITGATISSRAVIRILNHAVEKWQPLLAAYRSEGAK